MNYVVKFSSWPILGRLILHGCGDIFPYSMSYAINCKFYLIADLWKSDIRLTSDFSNLTLLSKIWRSKSGLLNVELNDWKVKNWKVWRFVGLPKSLQRVYKLDTEWVIKTESQLHFRTLFCVHMVVNIHIVSVYGVQNGIRCSSRAYGFVACFVVTLKFEGVGGQTRPTSNFYNISANL